MHRLQELVRLHRLGTGAREVARLLGMSPNTEREYREALGTAGLLDGPADALPELDGLKAAVPNRLPRQQVSNAEPAWDLGQSSTTFGSTALTSRSATTR